MSASADPRNPAPLLPMLGLLLSFAAAIGGCALLALSLATAWGSSCRQEGPSPANALQSEAPGTVLDGTSLWPLGRSCDWALDDGGRATVTSGSLSQTLLIYGLIVVGGVGSVLSIRGLRSSKRAGWAHGSGTGVVIAILAGASLSVVLAVAFAAPAASLAFQLSASTPTELCQQLEGSVSEPKARSIEGSFAWDPFTLHCYTDNEVTGERLTITQGWNSTSAILAGGFLALAISLFVIALRPLHSRQ